MKFLSWTKLTLVAAALLPVLTATLPAGAAEDGIAPPQRGMAMTAVEQSFGKPAEVLPPVGEPPITRWIYPAYTVYFEHQYVIHSVAIRPPKP